MTAHTDRRIEWILFALVMGLAALLRLYRLDLIDVRFDEASAPQLALGIVRGNWLPIAPFSGSVANHPPVYLYVLALPYLFTRDFMVIAAYRALLDVAAIAVCWWLCRRFFNLRVAVIACLLYAVGPWAIQFARRTWLAPMPLFSAVLLFGLLEAVQRRNPWGWAVAGWGLALSVGSHLAAVYLIPVVAVALVIGRSTLRGLPCVIGALPLVALAAIYLRFDAGQNFKNVRSLLGSATGQAQLSLDALRFVLWSSGGTHLSDLTGGAYPIWQAQALPDLAWVDQVQMAALAASTIVLLVLALRGAERQRRVTYALLVVWLVLPIALQVRHSRPLQIHYFQSLYPVPFIVMAVGADAWLRSMRTTMRRSATGRAAVGWVSVVVIGLIVGWQSATTLRFTQFIQRYDTGVGGYGPPLRSALDVVHLARTEIAAGRAKDVIVVAPGGDPSVNEPATVMDVLLADVPHRFADADAGLILREETAQYIFTPGTLHAFDMLMRHAAGDAIVREIPLRAGSDAVYRYARLPQARLTGLQAWSAQWENGVGLLGFRAGGAGGVAGGDALDVEIYLRVFREASMGENYHWFNHVYGSAGKFAARDGGGIHPSNWRVGDILLHRFTIPLSEDKPPEPYTLWVGAYRYPQLQNVMVLDADGRPVSDHVELKVE